MVVLKIRHSLSAVCLNDICSLPCLFKVPNAPRGWFHIKKSFTNSLASPLDRKLWWICPQCQKPSENQFTCSSNKCSWHFSPPASMPNHFFTFDIFDQLSSTLATTHDLHLPTHSNNIVHSMRDLPDGNYYRRVVDKESCDILTLTMSTDGIQPFNCSEKSIWPVTLVVNEINRKKRFSFQNLLVAAVWPGPTKPKRFEMAALLQSVVVQLKELEKGCYFECRSASGYVTRLLKVFLICACMDKPAQALVQNLPEPTAKFGCGRCEIRGKICVFFWTVCINKNTM